MQSELHYYRRRLAEETAAAAASSDAKAAAVHLELARRYDERIKLIERQRPAQLHLVSAA